MYGALRARMSNIGASRKKMVGKSLIEGGAGAAPYHDKAGYDLCISLQVQTWLR